MKQHIRTLALLDETDEPMVSAYLNLEGGPRAAARVLRERAPAIRKSMSAPARVHFDDALERIEAFLETATYPDARGTAIFARGGAQAFFLPLQFRVPLADWLSADAVPNLLPLIELKDSRTTNLCDVFSSPLSDARMKMGSRTTKYCDVFYRLCHTLS